MPCGRLCQGNDGHNAKSRERCDHGEMGCGIAHGWPHSAVPEDLAASAVTLLAAGGLGLLAGLADLHCPRCAAKFQRDFRHTVVVQHQHYQQVQLHHRQQPGGCCAPRTMFCRSEQEAMPEN